MTFRPLLLVALVSVTACEEKPEPPKAEPTMGTVELPPKSAATPPRPTRRPTRTAAPAPKDIPAPDDVAQPPKDAKKTKSGLVTKVLEKGKGKVHPKPEDKVRVNYTGWTKDGKMFDSSVAKGQPAEFGVGQVIKGWTEALQLMVEGEKRRMWIPADLAYGERPRFGPGGQLTFDVELLEIVQPPKPIPAPKDVKAPPKTAKKTESGLAYRVLKKGKGDKHPAASDRVTVVYTGWTPDGKMFDSSTQHDGPATFPLDHVIKGWTEGVQLMVEGDKMRFWIPSDLAYGDRPRRPGTPAGPLVFDIELVTIH